MNVEYKNKFAASHVRQITTINRNGMMEIDYKDLFEQAVSQLLRIEEALGIEDDGEADPDRTLAAIRDLQDQLANEILMSNELAEAVREICGLPKRL